MTAPLLRLAVVAVATGLTAGCSGTEPSNTPPLASFTASCDALECQFENTSTDEDGAITAHAWDFGDGGSSTEASPTHSYAAPGGEFTVTVTVTDNGGAVVTASEQVTVHAADVNRHPVPAFSHSCVLLLCTFTDESTDPDAGDGVMSRLWRFGDDSTSTEVNPSHAYHVPGLRFTVTLTVEDGHGLLASTTKLVGVCTEDPDVCVPDTPPPQAGQIAFVRDGRIHRVNTDGSGLVQLTAGPADDAPAWSPDGSRLAFSRGGEAAGIYVINADGSDEALRSGEGAHPTWSPDGAWIAFWCTEGICKVPSAADGGAPVPLLERPGMAAFPAWSPDGARLVFSSDWLLFDFAVDLWVMSSDGSDLTLLRDQQEELYQPAWSPDGQHIALVECPGGVAGCASSTIAVIGAGASSRVLLAATRGLAHPTWSPDGRVVAFSSGALIQWVSADGSQRGRIIANGSSPAWRP